MSVPVMLRRSFWASFLPRTPSELRRSRSSTAPRLVLCALGLLLGQGAQATLYLQDAINYTASTQLGNDSPWASPTTYITVGSGSLSYSGFLDISPAGNMVAIGTTASGSVQTYRPFDTAATSGTVYFSFLIRVTATPGTVYYYLGLLPSGTTSGGGRAADPVVFALNSSRQPGVSGAGSSYAYSSTAMALNTTYLIVLRYDFSTRNSSIWVNPSSSTFGGSAPTPDATTSGPTLTPASLGNLYLRAPSSGALNLDTLRIASTWAEVTPLPNQPPTIAPSGQPQSTNVVAGAAASFAVTVSGSPSFSYQWRKNSSDFGTAIVSSSPTNTLTLSSLTTNDAGSYDVVVTNNFGAATSTVAVLTVIVPPVVTLQPQGQSFCGSGTATFIAAASGLPVPTVRWQVTTNSGASWVDIPGATSTTYSFSAVSVDNANQYRAVFSNAGGTATSSAATLAVNSGPVAVNISTNGTQNQVFILSIATLLAACTAPDGDAFYLSLVGPLSTNGAPVAITATNTISYLPAPGFTGADRFSYTLTDILGCSATAEVQVTVGP